MMNGEEVFYIHHSVLHWAHQCSAGSYKCLYIWWFVCVIWKQNTILRRNNIVLNVKFHFAGELRGFAHCVCFFGFVCRVLRIWGMLSENVCKQLRKTVLHLFASLCHILYFNSAKFSIKQFSFIYFTVSVVRQRNEYEKVIETRPIKTTSLALLYKMLICTNP